MKVKNGLRCFKCGNKKWLDRPKDWICVECLNKVLKIVDKKKHAK